MSLLIKALKRAEQKHDESKLAAQNESATEIGFRSAEQDQTQIELQAVDTDDAELAMELAQMQFAQASAPENDSTDDFQPIPLPTLEISADAVGAKSDPQPAASIADSSSARPALELEGTPVTPIAATPAPPSNPELNNSIKAANRPATAAASTRSFLRIDNPSNTRLTRVAVYAVLGLTVAACIGWFTLGMFGFSLNKSAPRSSANLPVAVPVSVGGLDAPGNEEPQKADSPPVTSPSATSTPADLRSADAVVGQPTSEKSPASIDTKTADASERPRLSERVNPTRKSAKPAANKVNLARQQTNESAASATAEQPAIEVLQNPKIVHAETRIPEGTPAGIRLSRSETFAEQALKMNEQAWQLLSRNETTAARSVYEAVLRLDRNNGDAWLGLASIAVKQGDPVSAELHYKKALDIDPNDASAKAGLLSLRSTHEPAMQESRLRHLLAQSGGQPSLLFALGNTLASQARWADAQQAFFAAYVADQGNADYAFNLAVTLERLRQPQAAANHYQKALELAQRRPAQFSRAIAEQRVAALRSPSVVPE